MATIKAFTDLSQSKKLAEILPLESADMRFCFSRTLGGRITGHYPMIGREPSMGTIPCWSLAALLNILPKQVMLGGSAEDSYWHCKCEDESNFSFTDSNNPVDSCYEMILLLHELNWL